MNETDVNYSPCGVASCKRPRRTRGVCQSCYLTARLMVKNGETTWDELVSLKVVSNGRRGRRRTSPLRAYYAKRKAKAALNQSPLQQEESQVASMRCWNDRKN